MKELNKANYSLKQEKITWPDRIPQMSLISDGDDDELFCKLFTARLVGWLDYITLGH